ncbi:unnamed protein product [Phaedon cochleariae]|uniref:Aromatic-L-amino-acid decarboxylase n=1 Tax=Phaedon cochleariae TaxID=80249 RepID=A0A9N9SJ42_PHACE|nr:unnamed protein product [Phaedon cochleariae]
MDTQEFREFGKAAVDYIADYFETLRERSVHHSVEPGYLSEHLPKEVPKKGESWQTVLKDVDKLVQPGLTHWHHHNFHGYFPAANSYPAIGSASETTFLCLLTSRERKIQELQAENPDLKGETILGKLVAYSSDQSNSSIERAGLLGSIQIRLLPADENGKLSASTLSEAIHEDKSKGLIPCCLIACFGTTATCSFDDLTELGPVCEREKIWLHVDAAYAGAALACPELRHLMKGIEFSDSFNFNPHKWLLVNYDCSAMWLKDSRCMQESFNVDRIYLEHNKLANIHEYRHWQIPLGRRFRALKLWFVLRMYGVEGIQKYIRGHVAQAKLFEKLVRSDDRFEIVTSALGLVCFRMSDGDIVTQKLLDKIMERGNLFLMSATFNQKRMIRFPICSRFSEAQDIEYAWREICLVADSISTSRKRKRISKYVISREFPYKKARYLSNEIPETVPFSGQSWKHILPDVERVIVPGLTHWHSPHFHAYFPTANSYPGVVAELFLSGLGCLSMDWRSNPACVELEVRMMDWLAKMLGLPEHFLNDSEGPGGGVIQNAASESTLVGLLSGKQRKVKEALNTNIHMTSEEVRGKLVAYTSKESNSSVEKASLLASVPMRLLPTDTDCRLRGEVLREAIDKDKADGLIPCCVVASLGTTGTCAFDDLEELGKICEEENIWLHVDAAYAGAAFVCPEYRYLMKGIEYVDSFNFNPHKWFFTNSDCSAMWFKNTKDAEAAFKLKAEIPEEPLYEPQLENWQIPTSRRFRALKLWFVMRLYGVEGMQKYIRHQVSLAKYLESLVRSNEQFEQLVSSLGVVCFRLKGDDSLTQKLLDRIAERKKLFIMPYYYRKKLLVRFVICSRLTEKEDIDFAWREITSIVEELQKSTKQEKSNALSAPNLLAKVASTTFSPDLNEKLNVGLFL